MNNQQLIDEGYTEGKKSFEYHWKQIEENFDFEKVVITMKALDWVWQIAKVEHGNGMAIPSVGHVKGVVKHHAKECYDAETNWSSGGFTIEYEDNSLSIEFTVDCYLSE